MSTTNDTTNAIMDFLNLNGHVAWRNNTLGVFDPAKKIFRKGPRSARGTGDIICCLKHGLYLEVEIKTGKDRLSEFQKEHRAKILAVNGLHIIAKDFDHFRLQFESIVVPAINKHLSQTEHP